MRKEPDLKYGTLKSFYHKLVVQLHSHGEVVGGKGRSEA